MNNHRHRFTLSVTLLVSCLHIVCAVFFLPGAFATQIPHTAFTPDHVSPVTASTKPGKILRRFDPPPKPWLAGHRGVDLEHPVGAEVVASQAGRVRFAGTVAGVPTISIDHGNGLRTTYQPVHAYVSAGDEVHQSQVIGYLGYPIAQGPGLHWGATTGEDTYINPLSLLSQPSIRLKPVDGPAETPPVSVGR